MKIPFLLKLFKEILLEKNYPEISLALKGSKANLKSVLFILLYAFNNSDKFIFADKNNCSVTLTFYVDNTKFTIIRTKTPKADLKLFIDDVDLTFNCLKILES